MALILYDVDTSIDLIFIFLTNKHKVVLNSAS